MGGTFFGKIFWEEFFGRNSLFTFLKSAKVFEYEWNLGFCQDFGVMKGRKEVEFSILRSAIATQIREQMSGPDLHVFTLKFHSYFSPKKKLFFHFFGLKKEFSNFFF